MVDFDKTEIEIDEYDEEILRNLKHLYTTKTGERPLDRGFGLDVELIGLPMDVALNEYAVEVNEKTQMYEPRVEVEEVTFKTDAKNGAIIPHIKLIKVDSEELEEEDGY